MKTSVLEEILPRYAFSCSLEHLGVGSKGVVDDIVSAHAVGCDLHALNARQVTLDKLLKMLLKLGIAVKVRQLYTIFSVQSMNKNEGYFAIFKNLLAFLTKFV